MQLILQSRRLCFLLTHHAILLARPAELNLAAQTPKDGCLLQPGPSQRRLRASTCRQSERGPQRMHLVSKTSMPMLNNLHHQYVSRCSSAWRLLRHMYEKYRN